VQSYLSQSAFGLIDSRGTSLNSLAVIERPSGKLCDVISTSDLKHLLPSESEILTLYYAAIALYSDLHSFSFRLPCHFAVYK
jgi:hypothetical protein